MEISQLKRVIEAAILAAGSPQTLSQINDLFGEEHPPGVDSIHAAIELLQADYNDHGIALVEVASGWRFQVRPDVQPFIARLWTERQPRYTRALLETLALIAYRQPATRAEIEQIRGVAVSSNIIKTLEEREWIRVIGHRDVPGRPALFGTTRQFLDYFGLKSLDQLPALAELRDISDFEPELRLNGESLEPADPFSNAATATATDADADADADANSVNEATAPLASTTIESNVEASDTTASAAADAIETESSAHPVRQAESEETP